MDIFNVVVLTLFLVPVLILVARDMHKDRERKRNPEFVILYYIKCVCDYLEKRDRTRHDEYVYAYRLLKKLHHNDLPQSVIDMMGVAHNAGSVLINEEYMLTTPTNEGPSKLVKN